jgi:molybdopterin synthase sulfur carrier subunit
MTARVVFTAGFSRRYTGGVREFTVEAKNLRGVIKAMDQLFPGLGHHLEEETTVAIDGALHETAYFQPIRSGCEVFFIPQARRGMNRELAPHCGCICP